jgi:hypothetical protein
MENNETQEAQEETRIRKLHLLKLVTGDTIIGQSFDTAEEMREKNFIKLNGIVNLGKLMIDQGDGPGEVLFMSKWLEGSNITDEVDIPIAHIVGVSALKVDMALKYQRNLVQLIIKDAYETNKALQALTMEAGGTDERLSDDPLTEEDTNEVKIVVHEQTPERKPEDGFVTPESLMYAQMTGDLEVPDDEPVTDVPSYIKNGNVYH